MNQLLLQKNIGKARTQIEKILRIYSLGWSDVAPDVDDAIWQKTAPTAWRIRRALFAAQYPRLNEKTRS